MAAVTPERQGEYRRALGLYPTGVAVVTADTHAGVLAITVNSFTSVSLDPPLILWSLAQSSDRYGAFAHAERWGLSVVAAAQKDLAARFAMKGAGPAEEAMVRRAPGEAPSIDQALARFTCTTAFRVPAGDHLLILGAVDRFDAREGPALTYRCGAFGALR